MPYLTVDQAAVRVKTCRRLTFYSEYAPAVAGAVSSLLAPVNWEQDGTITVDQATQEMTAAWLDYTEIPCMIGAVLAFATNPLPDGILPCDGGTYARVDYPLLYAALAPIFIIDADNFVTPDLLGRVVVGSGAGAGLTPRILNQRGGQEAHTLTIPEMPAHQHGIQDPGIVQVEVGLGAFPQSDPGLPSFTTPTGGGLPHPNMQPFTVLTYGIIAR
jgi:microcystin-dependent protein